MAALEIVMVVFAILLLVTFYMYVWRRMGFFNSDHDHPHGHPPSDITPDHDKRGVVGLGEPAAIALITAIANATANAIGVRVPEVPLTPNRVLAALERRNA